MLLNLGGPQWWQQPRGRTPWERTRGVCTESYPSSARIHTGVWKSLLARRQTSQKWPCVVRQSDKKGGVPRNSGSLRSRVLPGVSGRNSTFCRPGSRARNHSVPHCASPCQGTREKFLQTEALCIRLHVLSRSQAGAKQHC